eukprot:scaffold94948_cov52-Phaeocystis_antarctica.AAC.1
MEHATNPSRGKAARVCQRRLGCRSGLPHEPRNCRCPAQADSGFSERGQPSSGRKRSDRGASAARVGHLVRAGPPRAARALVESRHRGGEEREEQGYLHFRGVPRGDRSG